MVETLYFPVEWLLRCTTTTQERKRGKNKYGEIETIDMKDRTM